MDIQLINTPNPTWSGVEQILYNRGIAPAAAYHYLHTTDEDILNPIALGENNLIEGAKTLLNVINSHQRAALIVDSDCDGFTSSALLINYLYDLFPNWTKNNLVYFLHEGKQHGLKDCIDNLINDNYALIICPDSSSNDYEEHELLKSKGKEVLVLDHHEADHISENAIIINNQLSDYPNKQLSGVGVVWQFCRFIDILSKTDFANNYLDLVALGVMADMMSMLSLETKHLITKGFRPENIKNPFIYYMAEKNRYSLGGHITPMGAAFYIAPFVNAIVRSGALEEKILIFKSMIKFEALNKIPSTKRGHKLGEEELLVEQAIRTAVNVKNRQTRSQDAGLAFLENMIEEQNLLDNKVLLFLLEPGQVDKNIAGLIANKFMAKYQRPCCILTQVSDDSGISYQGSARGCDKVGIINFKDICEETGVIMYAEGHQGAFGLGIQKSEINNFIEKTNEILKDMPDTAIYSVDYIFKSNNFNSQIILDIANLEDLWGKDMDEPYIAFKDFIITSDMVTLMSPDKRPTLKIQLPNGVSLIKFRSSQEEYESFLSKNGVRVDLVGRCNKNEWNGSISPQIFIEDYEITKTLKYLF